MTGGLGDLGLSAGSSQPPQQQQPSFQDPFGAPAPSPAASSPAEPSLPVLLSADKAKGLTLRGQLTRMDGRIGVPPPVYTLLMLVTGLQLCILCTKPF